MKLRLDTLLFRLQFLLLTGILMTQALGFSAISSLLFTATFPGTLCIWLARAGERIGPLQALGLGIVMLACISVCMDGLMNGSTVSFGYFKKLMMFCATVLLLSAAGDYRPDAGDVRFFFRCNAVLSCFLVGMYLLRKEQMHLLNGIVTVYLTFRATNPNLAAVFLCGAGMVEAIHAAVCSDRKVRLLHGFLALAMLYFILETRSRNAMLLAAVFLGACLVCYCYSPEKLPRKGYLAALIVSAPLLFAVGYLLLIYLPQVQQAFSFLIGEGKGLDSRVKIWRFAVEAFWKSPVFGAYSRISEGTGASQMHNSHLDILASYGAPVLAALVGFLFLLLQHRENRESHMRFLCMAGFSALLLSGIGEAMLFSGGMGIYIYAAVLRILANYQPESGEENRCGSCF